MVMEYSKSRVLCVRRSEARKDAAMAAGSACPEKPVEFVRVQRLVYRRGVLGLGLVAS